MDTDLLIQRPAVATELLLLAHGYGADAHDLAPVAQALARTRPGAFVVSLQAPERIAPGGGRQWFALQSVSEANRPARVAAALPRYLQAVQQWQRESGLDPAATSLLGFSQGAILALASTQLESPPARRVIAIAGRFAEPPRRAPAGLALHLLHGEQDAVMPVGLAADAASQWRALGGNVTLDRFDQLGHGIDARLLRRVTELLAGEG